MEKFSENLVRIMQEGNLSQTALSAATKISQAAISRYVNGSASLGAKELADISKFLHVTMDDLWNGEGNTEMNMAEDHPSIVELAELKRSLRIVYRAMSEPKVRMANAHIETSFWETVESLMVDCWDSRCGEWILAATTAPDMARHHLSEE